MAENGFQRNRFFWPLVGLLTALGAFFALAFWQIFRYGRRVFRQPALAARTVAPTTVDDNGYVLTDGGGIQSRALGLHQLPFNHHPVDHASLEAEAAHIAAVNLRAGIEKRHLEDGQEKLILCAGVRNFREPWARDFGFASFGLVELDEFQTAQECLEVFLLTQKPSGQFPVKVHSTGIVDRYIHSFFKREQPTYNSIKPKYITAHKTISLDGNALLVAALLNYAQRTGNHDFTITHWPALKRATIWLEEHAFDSDGLLHQKAFADWADSIARSGRVLYTNVVYWKALHDMGQAASTYGFPDDEAHFASRARQIRASINDHFWRADLGYYVTSQFFDNLSSSGNLLAVAWGMARAEQAHSILDKMNEFAMADPVPTQVVHRAYPSKFIAIENRAIGIGHYHTYAAWLWLGAWHVIALTRMERLAEAEDHLFRMSKVIVRDRAVHEVYDPSGKYLSTFWYTSEAPLTWSAGMFVYAYHVYHRRLKQEGV